MLSLKESQITIELLHKMDEKQLILCKDIIERKLGMCVQDVRTK